MGIIPRSMNYIFNKINNMSCDIEFSVKCSYIQIYNEKIQDLLDTRKTDLSIREDKKKGIWVEDSTEIYVSSVKEMEDVFTCGANNRTVSATEMNAGSSRSHSLFIVTIFQKNIVTDSTKSAKVFFVDLAGSEKMSKTGITGGMGLKEAQNNIGFHDESKYSDIEFEPYRLRFYPTEEENIALQSADARQQQQIDFETAWHHHYTNNPHHPKYWVQEDGSIKDMDIKYIIEMLCDWLSFGDDIRVWYANKADSERKAMSVRTREITEELMELIYTKQIQ
jgi:hypothetical protein